MVKTISKRKFDREKLRRNELEFLAFTPRTNLTKNSSLKTIVNESPVYIVFICYVFFYLFRFFFLEMLDIQRL